MKHFGAHIHIPHIPRKHQLFNGTLRCDFEMAWIQMLVYAYTITSNIFVHTQMCVCMCDKNKWIKSREKNHLFVAVLQHTIYIHEPTAHIRKVQLNLRYFTWSSKNNRQMKKTRLCAIGRKCQTHFTESRCEQKKSMAMDCFANARNGFKIAPNLNELTLSQAISRRQSVSQAIIYSIIIISHITQFKVISNVLQQKPFSLSAPWWHSTFIFFF